MKRYFFIGLLGLLLFEILNVYLIMPMPGSQKMNSIDVAYFLYKWRWLFRVFFCIIMLYAFIKSRWKRIWIPITLLIVVGLPIYYSNFVMAADHMFYQPENLLMATTAANKVDTGRLIIGVVVNNEAKAYPIRYLGFHHQVQDTVGGKPLMITYCTVCRTGRVFEPVVNGKQEKFRLVGMDHFNAMFEDATTGSWWRQATGEAITGKLKGQKLPEVLSTQSSLGKWLQLYPNSLIMQTDSTFINSYDTTFRFESGKSKSTLTGTDSLSWKDKSWVVGVKFGEHARAYDWNKLKLERIIHDKIGQVPVALVLASDNKSFFVFEMPNNNAQIDLQNDTLTWNKKKYTLDGRAIDTTGTLKRLPASQEFWHSWRSFNPGTTLYK